MEFVPLVLFVLVLALVAVSSLKWGYDSRTDDDKVRVWK